MSFDNLEEARYESGSPLQLLIFLTVGGTTILGLLVANYLQISVAIPVLFGATILTVLRGTKKVLTMLSLEGRGGIRSRINKVMFRRHFRKLFDVYLSMLLLSLFCYGVGVALHRIYHVFF